MSEQRLRNLYLPPFKAAIDAGSDTVDVLVQRDQRRAGLRATSELETDMLKGEWGFDGFIESDYTAVAELRACPPQEPRRRARVRPRRRGRRPGRGGRGAERRHRLRDGQHVDPRLRQAAARRGPHLDAAPQRRGAADPAGQVPRRAVREPVRRPGQGGEAAQLPPDAVARRARSAAGRSMVLLKNEGGDAAADPAKKTAVIGPLAKNGHDMLGPWWGRGRDEDAVTVLDGIKAQSPGATLRRGLLARQQRAAEQHARRRLRLRRRLRRRRSPRQGRRPGRARARRAARDERRGRLAQRDRPARAASRS